MDDEPRNNLLLTIGTTTYHRRKRLHREASPLCGDEIVALFAPCFEDARTSITINCAAKFITTRLGDDVDDSAGGLTVLGFEAARFDLNLFNKGGIDASAKRSIRAREGADSAESRISDVDAVSNIQIIQRRTAVDRGIVATAAKAVRSSRGQVKQAGDATSTGIFSNKWSLRLDPTAVLV